MDCGELRAAIARRGKSQKELAQALGTTQRTLYNKMRGTTQFKSREIQALARELGLDLAAVDAIFFDRSVNDIH